MTIEENNQTGPSTPQVPSPPTPRVPEKRPVTRVGYHGSKMEIFKIHIVNILLSIITLGIYSFWGKTRIRQYMTSHIVLAKDRFEYTGTGMELFTGWLKALLIFLPVIVAMQIPFINLLALPVFFGIIAVALFLAMRYRLSRTRWRGIRFSLGGSVKEYLILSIKRTFFNIVSLGFTIPKSDIMKWSYIAGNMRYGDLAFKYRGDHNLLFKTHIKTLLIGVGIFIGMAIIVFLSGVADEESGSEQGIIIAVISFYLAMFGAIFARLWYYAALWREKFRTLELNGLRFKAEVTGLELFKLYAVNFLIVIFTLGLGKPIALHRTLSFFAGNILIGGDIETLKAEQDRILGPTGMGDALATDVGFDLGM